MFGSKKYDADLTAIADDIDHALAAEKFEQAKSRVDPARIVGIDMGVLRDTLDKLHKQSVEKVEELEAEIKRLSALLIDAKAAAIAAGEHFNAIQQHIQGPIPAQAVPVAKHTDIKAGSPDE